MISYRYDRWGRKWFWYSTAYSEGYGTGFWKLAKGEPKMLGDR